MAYDATLVVSPDAVGGKAIDMDQVSTAAGTLVYQQRATLVGETEGILIQLLSIARAQLAVSRAMLMILQAGSNTQSNEEDFAL